LKRQLRVLSCKKLFRRIIARNIIMEKGKELKIPEGRGGLESASRILMKGSGIREADSDDRGGPPTSNAMHSMGFDIMSIIDSSDRALLENKRIQEMSVIDWGKSMAVSNQYIHQAILNRILPEGFRAFTADDADLPEEVKTANNCSGFDIIIRALDGTLKRVQSKLRQVKGQTDWSQQTHFETTRRDCDKNKDRKHTGHVCYALDEFDYAMVSLVNVAKDLSNRNNCNLWSFAFIPISDLEDKERKCCKSHIPADVLKKRLLTSSEFAFPVESS